jgi:hypothetical protein
LTEGKLLFNTATVNRTSAPSHESTIGKDGTYSVTTLVGTNTVAVQGPALTKYPWIAYQSLGVVVNGGENTFDVDLQPPPPR